MKSIGGYLELECGRTPLYHAGGIYTNLCRSAIRYLVRALGIKKIHIPYFTCPTVPDALRAEVCEVVPYHIDRTFMPIEDFPVEDFILYNNYFGVLGQNVKNLASRYPNLIVDNAQAFYSKPTCRAAVYSPRKFFGLPDGGILVGKDIPHLSLPNATSWSEMAHLLKRIDLGAQEGYDDFRASDERLAHASVMAMSKLTSALMGNLDYNFVATKRKTNFTYLHQRLRSTFPFAQALDDVPLAYPVFTDNPSLRAALIQEKIFVPSYWPGVQSCDRLDTRILPLPIDQRYGIEEMDRIVEVLNG